MTDKVYRRYNTFGSGMAGWHDGPSRECTFNQPYAVCVDDKSGDIFVADNENHVIRRIDLKGNVSTYAGNGSGTEGFLDSVLHLESNFQFPCSIILDHQGNLLVGDNASVKRIYRLGSTSAGSPTNKGVVTVAGSDTRGYADGPSKKARFKGVTGLALDKDNNILAVDYFNNRVRKIDPQGNTTTLPGCETDSVFDNPWGIVLDEQENVIISDKSHHLLRKILKGEGTVLTFAGIFGRGFTDGNNASPSTATPVPPKFNEPCQLSLDKHGNIFVADRNNSVIRKIDKKGTVTTVQITPELTLNYPYGVCVRNNNNIIIADTFNHRIIELIYDHSRDWPDSHHDLPTLLKESVEVLLLCLLVARIPKDVLILISKAFLDKLY